MDTICFEQRSEAFRSRISNYAIINQSNKNLSDFFVSAYFVFKEKTEILLNMHHMMKLNTSLKLKMYVLKSGGFNRGAAIYDGETDENYTWICYLSTPNEIVNLSTELKRFYNVKPLFFNI